MSSTPIRGLEPHWTWDCWDLGLHWLLLNIYSVSLVSLGVKHEMMVEISSRWGRGEGSWKAGQALLPTGRC